jgi:hypothetical protein
MCSKTITSVTTFVLCALIGEAHAASQQTLDRLVDYAKQACLVGTQFDLHADENGNLSFKNLLKPGEEVKIDANVRQSTGASAIINDQLRIMADKQIQECMTPFIERIMEAMLGPSGQALPESTPYHLVIPKGKVELICDERNHLTYKGPRPSLAGRFDIVIDGALWVAEPGDQFGTKGKPLIITLMEAKDDGAVFDVRCTN